MELLQLQYFYESAATENFAKTAEKHFVPTSSVSGAVRRLEKELGCPLFDRSSNRLTLNDNGRLLQQALQVAFDAIDKATSRLSPARAQPLRVLARIPEGLLAQGLEAFRRAAPEVTVQADYGHGKQPESEYDVILELGAGRYPDRQATSLYHLELRVADGQRAAPAQVWAYCKKDCHGSVVRLLEYLRL